MSYNEQFTSPFNAGTLATVASDGRVKLSASAAEREQHDNLADLFSIIKTSDALEKCFMRDYCSAKEYTPQCFKLISQFKAAHNIVANNFNIEQFMAQHRLECRAAYDRLVVSGLPITQYYAENNDDSGAMAKNVAEAVQYFITSMDSLKLNMTAVDQLHPLLVDLHSSLEKIKLPKDYQGTAKVQQWINTLQGMRASDELTEEEGRQMLFDLDAAYTAFHKALASSA